MHTTGSRRTGRLGRATALTAVATTFMLSVAATAQAKAADPVTPIVGGLVGVVSTALDTTLGLITGANWGYSPEETSMTSVNQAIGAASLQKSGVTGKGVGVALLDTGVVPVKGLTSGNVVNGPDLSLDNASASASTSARHLDGYGHGTHLAGIIAGNDGTSSGFKGVAPGATLVSIRAGSASGAVDVSQVIAGIDWAVQHRDDNGMNIRVLNLSYGTDGLQNYMSDPLTAAVERAWRAGIVVVVAGGNRGNTQSSLDNPATDPYVIAVGADDTHGTASSLDDTIPSFSSIGSSSRHVDLVAPGQSIVSLRDPGSVVDTEYPSARVNGRYFKGSGTSQAAAVVSGAVALLLQERPSLTPDQVKALLMASASTIPLASPQTRGSGLVNVWAASLLRAPVVTQTWPTSNGLGSLDNSRGDQRVSDNGVELTGEADVLGDTWNTQGSAYNSGQWTGGAWNGSKWAGQGWTGKSFGSQTWAAISWSGNDWAGVPWSSHTSGNEGWSGGTWSGSGWVSHSWSDAEWSSHSWSGNGW